MDQMPSSSTIPELTHNLGKARKGILFKWTNYVHGWQSRFFVVKNGILMYYRSEQETSFGCRGAISIMASTLTLHEFDCCRFDVGVSDYVWYLRASSKDERDEWLQVLNLQCKEQQQQSIGLSITTNDGLELSLKNQTTTTPIIPLLNPINNNKTITTKTTTSCQNNDSKENNKYHHTQPPPPQTILPSSDEPNNTDEPSEFFDALDDQIMIENVKNSTANINLNNNNSVLHHNTSLKMVYHANENSDQPDRDAPQIPLNKSNHIINNIDNNENNLKQNSRTIVTTNTNTTSNNKIISPIQSIQHPLWPKIDLITSEQLFYAQMGLGQQGTHEGWQLFAEDGQMRMYTREMEIDGLVCDPLKAVHVVKGITGFEMCHRFFSPDLRFEWEQTLESMKVVEEIDKNTQIFHQIHKRVWPAAQRDAVFWSHIRQVAEPKASCLSPDDVYPKNRPDLKLQSVWIVCNNSADKPDIPLDRCVRVRLTVSLVCETYISANLDSNLQGMTRDDLTCKIIYSSTINPGGWAPASVLRTLYKREYPRFLKNFSNYVISSTKTKPITFE